MLQGREKKEKQQSFPEAQHLTLMETQNNSKAYKWDLWLICVILHTSTVDHSVSF